MTESELLPTKILTVKQSGFYPQDYSVKLVPVFSGVPKRNFVSSDTYTVEEDGVFYTFSNSSYYVGHGHGCSNEPIVAQLLFISDSYPTIVIRSRGSVSSYEIGFIK